jgi:hypothetical protein
MMMNRIWDSLAKFDEENQRRQKVADLRQKCALVGTTCGDCDKWMKSSLCPLEKNVNGRNHGPSNKQQRCGQYVEASSATRRRESLSVQLAAIQEPAP